MIDCGHGYICNFTMDYSDDCFRVILEPENCVCHGIDTCAVEEVIDDPGCPTWACYSNQTTTTSTTTTRRTTTTARPLTMSDFWADFGIGMAIFIPLVLAIFFIARYAHRYWTNYVMLDNVDAEEAIGQ